MSNNRSASRGWPQQSALAFGLQVEEIPPSNYLNTLVSSDGSFDNSFSDFHFKFKKVPASIISSHASEQSEPLDLSHEFRLYQQADQHIEILTGQSELRIGQVWSMAGELSSDSYSINDQHPAIISTLQDTSGNCLSGLTTLTAQSLSVADIHYKPCGIANPLFNNQNPVDPCSTSVVRLSLVNPQLNSECLRRNTPPAGNEWDFKASANGSGESLTLSHEKTCLKAYVRPEKQEVSKRTREQIEKRKAYELSEKRKAYKKEYQRVYRQTEKGKACRKAHQKAYRESEKGKAWWKSYAKSEKRRAYQKAYRESEKGKAWWKSYEQSEKRRASQKAYRSSEKGRAYQKAYEQREERKAYQKAYQRAYKAVFKNTGNREQARIAGKQAVLLVREPNKVKNNERESTPVSLIP
ncbi:hypothetical protein [Endozoicomonas sp. SCSIO W0465]|uniref:hypothetical protein n=1 Tax=Endozoicomonas sp. SCSIO W0465 TaxID=2918516 RepID=UPI002074F4C4|nr:hypothetical protein [Endozoicomonas sp. SCSIO W0465]USE34508.1 hypothetical protein MJO57_20500 [Endozoicomonas sp. SCSIO W0465]